MKEELRRIQLEILVEFDRVCKENEIEYSLAYGTALGAVRHSGFIPWDDDVDVLMVREEYDKICKIWNERKDKRYFLQNYTNDYNYAFCFAKMRDSNTTLVETDDKALDINHGVFIDIFIYDYLSKNKFKKKIQLISCKLLCVLLQKNKYKNNLKGIIGKIICLLFPGKIRIKSCVFLEKLMSQYDNENSDYIADIAVNLPTSKEVLQKFKRINFEKYKFDIMQNTDEYLTKNYGDYMKLPDKEYQEAHHEYYKFDSKNSYKKYKGIFYCEGES